MPSFARYLGIDYSGARTPTESLTGLRVYEATAGTAPVEVPPPPSVRRYWSRRGLAEWLVATLKEGAPTLVGIDHAFSFPIRYFETYWIPPEWPTFLDDFQQHWPTDQENMYVDFVRDGMHGNGASRRGSTDWRRVCEQRCRTAKSVFHFDVPGSVAKSTHAGLPWLRYLRQQLGRRVHFWPFDGWTPEPGRSVIAEVYPSLWSRSYPSEDRNAHQHNAYSAARWMAETDARDELGTWFQPQLNGPEEAFARVEGWILGVP